MGLSEYPAERLDGQQMRQRKPRMGTKKGKVLKLGRKVFGVSKCSWCGVAVRWIERVPFEENGIDHRTRCVGMPKESRRKVVDANHERDVAQFLRQAGRAGNRGPRSK
jgi:hypothetical protein